MNPPALRVALRLARRELRGGLNGFRIFLACLALGVAAIAGVQSVAGSILAGLHDNGRVLLGGDIAVRSVFHDLTADQRAYLRRTSAALTRFLEARTMVRRPGGDHSTMAELKAVGAGYPLFGRMVLEGGRPFAGSLARRDGVWGALLDPGLAQRLGVKVGDRIAIGSQTYQVRALIQREPDRVGSGGGFGFWPRVMVALDSLSGSGLLAPGSMLYYQYRLKLPAGVSAASYRARLNKAFPRATWRVRDYRNAAPRLQDLIDRLALFLTLVGLTALLVGGVGVSNAVRAYLDSRLATLAMLKCIGAPRRTLFQTYLAQLLVLAAGGIALGLIIGALTPPLADGLLRHLLPIPLAGGIYPGALASAALFGLLTTLSFAVWPLARALEIPGAALFRAALENGGRRPRWPYQLLAGVSALLLAALAVVSASDRRFALWFVGGAVVTLLLFRLAAWLVMWLTQRLPRSHRPGLRLALANLARPGAPTPSVVLSLGLGLTVLVAVGLVQGNMHRRITAEIPKQAPSFFFLDIQHDQLAGFRKLVGGVPGTSHLLAVPYLRGPIVKIKGMPPAKALVEPGEAWMIRGDRGLTYTARPPANTHVVAGKWWPPDYSGPPLLSVHRDAMKAFDLHLGDTVTFSVLGRRITGRIANVRELDWSSLQLNFAFMFSPEPLKHAPHGYLATVVATPKAEVTLQKRLTERYPNITVIRVKDVLDQLSRITASIAGAVQAVAAITLLAGTLVLAGAIAAGHRRRVYDSVILKVLGATRRDVLRAFLLEYGLLGVMTALIAAVIGTVTAWAMLTQVMHSDWRFLPATVIATLLLCSAITLALGFAGTWRALGQPAAPLLRNE